MSVIEVAAPYALTVAQYICGVAKKWWDNRKQKKEIEENEPKVEKLLNSAETLQSQLAEKKEKQKTFNEEDVNQVKQQLTEVKLLEGAIKEEVTTEKAFNSWVDSQVENEDLDVEELAEIYRPRLARFIDESRQKGVSRYKLDDYKELLSYIETNLGMVRKARKKVFYHSGPLAEEKAADSELNLRNCLKDAEELLRTD